MTSAPGAQSSPSALATPGRRATSSISASLERRGRAELARERVLRGDLDVDAAVDRALQLREAAADLVGQHVGAGDHRDAEQHRDRGQHGAQLALGRALAARARSRRVPSGGRGSASCEGRVRRSTMRPSARNSTESAIAAAPASWVTITIVWPNSSTARRSSSSTSRLAFESRLPVGSSANTTAGPRDQRARDRDALRLAAGELVGPVRRAGPRGRRSRSASRARRGRARRRRSGPAAGCSARRSGRAAGCSSGR